VHGTIRGKTASLPSAGAVFRTAQRAKKEHESAGHEHESAGKDKEKQGSHWQVKRDAEKVRE